MSQQELQEKYGALYPGTKLPPLVTADGVEVEPFMTVYQVDPRDSLISWACFNDFRLEKLGSQLMWQDHKTGMFFDEWYASKSAAYNAAADILARQRARLDRRIATLRAKAGEPCE